MPGQGLGGDSDEADGDSGLFRMNGVCVCERERERERGQHLP